MIKLYILKHTVLLLHIHIKYCIILLFATCYWVLLSPFPQLTIVTKNKILNELFSIFYHKRHRSKAVKRMHALTQHNSHSNTFAQMLSNNDINVTLKKNWFVNMTIKCCFATANINLIRCVSGWGVKPVWCSTECLLFITSHFTAQLQQSARFITSRLFISVQITHNKESLTWMSYWCAWSNSA